jgi:uroporphyrinogen decarboxylase
MNCRERFLTALGGDQPDRVPIFDWVNNPALYEHYLGGAPGFYDGGRAAELASTLGLDAAWVPDGGFLGLPAPRWQWRDATDFVDEWSVGWRLGAGSWPLAFPMTHPVQKMADWQHLAIPDPTAAWRVQHVTDAVAAVEGRQDRRIAVVAGIRGPFSSAWMLMGLTAMSYALVDQPALLEAVFSATADFWAEAGRGLINAGADAIVIHDDQGSNTGTFFAPKRWRQVVLPHLRRQIATLAAIGKPVILHSCGNINAILPDLVSTGIAGLNNLQQTAGMDLAAVKATYGLKLCLIGNVDATRLMPTATPAEVEAAVVECLRVGAPGGGYVLATDHSFHEGIPIENVRTFIEAGLKHGAY